MLLLPCSTASALFSFYSFLPLKTNIPATTKSQNSKKSRITAYHRLKLDASTCAVPCFEAQLFLSSITYDFLSIYIKPLMIIHLTLPIPTIILNPLNHPINHPNKL
ncbi:hypothetical protein LINPERHAP1_LOCUS22443 [Linum perenne]